MKTTTATAAKKTAETTTAKISESQVVETQNNGLTPEQKNLLAQWAIITDAKRPEAERIAQWSALSNAEREDLMEVICEGASEAEESRLTNQVEWLCEVERQNKLNECEATIKAGQSAFFETAYAVKMIRDEELYQPEFKTMGEYFAEKWDFTPSDISRFTNAADVLDTLKEHKVRTLPTMEGHTRALAELSEGSGKKRTFGKCVPVWVAALNSGKKITAALIRELANPKSATPATTDQKQVAQTADSVAQSTPQTSDKTITASITLEISFEGVLNLMESKEFEGVSIVTKTDKGAEFQLSAPDKAGVFAKLAKWSLANLIGSATVKF